MAARPIAKSKLRAIEFVKMADQEILKFNFIGSIAAAENFVRAIRMQVSRMRMYVKSQHVTVKPFELKLKDLQYNENTHTCEISLLKDASDEKIAEDLDEIFTHIAGNCRL